MFWQLAALAAYLQLLLLLGKDNFTLTSAIDSELRS